MLKLTPDKNDKYLYFDNDDAFYNFAVIPELVIIENPEVPGQYYTDFNFSDPYNRAKANGKKFVIRDWNSQIVKRGHVSYRTVTKPVDVLDEDDALD